MPDVSVVIPTYNRKEYLQEAIASCFDGNGAVDVEVVVVDDGSTDGTRKFLQCVDDERVRPVFQEHKGGQHARNHGLREATGDYIKFLDDDDWLTEGALQAEVSALNATDVEMSYGAYQWVTPDGSAGRKEKAKPVDDIVGALLSGRLRTHSLRFTFRRTLVEGLEWDPELPCRQDVGFALQVAARDPSFVRVDRVIACFRQHDGTRVSAQAGARLDTARVHAMVLLVAVQNMEATGVLNTTRKRDAARGLWTWAHVVAGRDLKLFDELYSEIQRLVSDFSPSRQTRILKALDALFGPRMTEYVVYPARRAKQILT